MTDLRDRIAAVLERHKTDPYSDWECQCGSTSTKWHEHVADAVIRELEADYVLVPKSHTLSRVARKDFLIAQAEAELRRMKGADDECD